MRISLSTCAAIMFLLAIMLPREASAACTKHVIDPLCRYGEYFKDNYWQPCRSAMAGHCGRCLSPAGSKNPLSALSWSAAASRLGPSRKSPAGSKCVTRTANSVVYVYSRENPNDARIAKVLTEDEARRIASNIAKLPGLLDAIRTEMI